MTRSKGVGQGRPPSVSPGEKYGRLTVVECAGSVKGNRTYRCDCECGRIVVVTGKALRAGHTKSCGCYKSDVKAEWARTSGWQSRHGLSRHPNYTLWQGVHRRCEDPGNKSYQHYGAKGIKVCERWTGRDGFTNFLADMGPSPRRGWHLHRIDPDRDYEPGNCEWLSPAEHNAVHAKIRRAVGMKLTPEIVRECRARFQKGLASIRELRIEFGVADATMRHAVKGVTWKHVA
jgi:hypothetical protein